MCRSLVNQVNAEQASRHRHDLDDVLGREREAWLVWGSLMEASDHAVGLDPRHPGEHQEVMPGDPRMTDPATDTKSCATEPSAVPSETASRRSPVVFTRRSTSRRAALAPAWTRDKFAEAERRHWTYSIFPDVSDVSLKLSYRDHNRWLLAHARGGGDHETQVLLRPRKGLAGCR